MSTALVSFIASVFYGFPSAALYFLTFYIIKSNKKTFDSSFFQIYVYDGFMNMFTWIMGFFLMRLNSITCYDCFMAPFYKNIGRYISLEFIATMATHMAYVQYSISTLVSINRLSVLLNFNFFEPVWKKFTWFFILLIYFLPFLSTHVVFYYEAKVVYLEEDDSYSVVVPDLPAYDIYIILVPFMFLTTIICVICNSARVIFLRSLSIQRKKAESNFLIILSITCSVQIVGTIITIALMIPSTSPRMLSILGMILPYASDGLSLVQPWLLVCFSHSMRKEMQSIFGSKKKESSMFQVRSVTN